MDIEALAKVIKKRREASGLKVAFRHSDGRIMPLWPRNEADKAEMIAKYLRHGWTVVE